MGVSKVSGTEPGKSYLVVSLAGVALSCPLGIRFRGQAEAGALLSFHLFVNATLGAIRTQNETQYECEEDTD